MGEWFLDLRCDLLPDVCLATRALGHPVIAFNEHSDRNAAMSVLRSGKFWGVPQSQLPLSDGIYAYSMPSM